MCLYITTLKSHGLSKHILYDYRLNDESGEGVYVFCYKCIFQLINHLVHVIVFDAKC